MHCSRREALGLVAVGVGGWLVRAGAQANSADWPQFRGPNRDGASRETGLLKQWPASGPNLLWKATGLGSGYSAPSIAAGRIFVMGLVGDEEVVWALNLGDGKEIWRAAIGRPVNPDPGRRGAGPRGTPTVDGDALYAIGVGGELVCLERGTGKLRWQKNLVSDFGGRVPSWGYSESPLVDGEQVVVTPGGRNTMVALNKKTGDTVWQAAVPERDGAAYSSCIAADVDGQRQYIQFTARGVVGVAAGDGRYLWRYNAPANGTANCSSPIYHDQLVFAASAYQTGGGAVRLTTSGASVTATEVYFTRNMQNHHGGMVLVGGLLYGFDNSSLNCLDFKTGEVKWMNRSVGKGSITFADGHFYARSERGPVALVEASPTGYAEKGRFDPEKTSLPSWPYPVVTGGRLLLRDQDFMLCYDVKG